MAEQQHLLVVEAMQDEGVPKLAVKCPAGDGEECPYATRVGGSFIGCLVEFELDQIGSEIIEGTAEGSGPWPVTLRYDGVGDSCEAWVTLVGAENV